MTHEQEMDTVAGRPADATAAVPQADLDAVLVVNILRTHTRISPFIDASLRDQNLTAAQLNALLVIRSAGTDGLLMGQIGQRLVVTRSNVTALVDRLERAGWVVRAEHADRRATVVRLTPAGQALVEQTGPHYAAVLAEVAGCLSPAEKRTLVELLTRLRRQLRHRRTEGR